MTTPNELFKKYEVPAKNIEDFLKKYTKYSRHEGRGNKYAEARIKSHSEDFSKYGFCLITHHDSVTGDHVAYYGREAN